MVSRVLVKAEHLSRRYGERTAVSDLSLQLQQGEVLGLLGPNGAGKTTTLRMLAGCLAPSEGRVLIDGADLAEDAATAKRSLGYLPEQPPLYPELTVNEYLTFCAGLHGVERSERDNAVGRARHDCGLNDVGGRVITHLSKGYQQRVGLAQAIVHRPRVIILDEPTVGLDPIQIREIRKLIGELAQEHSIILSSHILSEIQATCTRVCIINEGRLVFADSMENVKQHTASPVLMLRLQHPPTEQALRLLPGVTGVTQQESGRFRLEIDTSDASRVNLARHCVEQGWGLLEMATASRTLEEIFVELTARGETQK